ncbi:MAG: phosphoenolpyruvate synthase, partial [Candidatus Eremiobacteraeota bacterium]|nr:phosphoenolpyruvate synthase [Candidatus Eremiobacteraeota bacterium]
MPGASRSRHESLGEPQWRCEAARVSYLLDFQEVDRSQLRLAGGKGANLGELTRIQGVLVPSGFCVTTAAFQEIAGSRLDSLLEELAQPQADLGEISASLRQIIESTPIPEKMAAEIAGRVGPEAYAVRSSATAEDLPTASFAGQQDSYLNVIGLQEILRHISRCWASLFSERAVIYRRQNGFDHRRVALSVIVQRMVIPQVSGILFTADPVTSNRKVISIDASFGLGEALVSGLVSADNFKVRDHEVVETTIAVKKLAVYALKEGGTEARPLAPEQQKDRSLTEEQVLRLAALGRRIEAHLGAPQDIEWCLADDTFYILQSRPITTLFPIPEAKDDGYHVYVSVGHQQMMTDAMKPLGLSFWLATAGRPMDTAGGRLFVNVGPDLASPERRNIIVNVLGKGDPLIRDAITTILEREDYVASPVTDTGPAPANFQTRIDYDPDIVAALIARSQASIAELKRDIASKSGAELIDFILENIRQLKKSLTDPQSFA